MKQLLLWGRRSRIALAGISAAVMTCSAASSAVASTPSTTVDTSACTNPAVTQPFLSIGDSNWYTMMRGESPDSFAGSGWTLTGGASLKTAMLADGAVGQVLDLPSGARAVSPAICVNGGFTTARTEVRDVKGSEGVQFYVSYDGTATWNTPKNTGQVHGPGTSWGLSTPVNLQPSNASGWQIVKFTFIPGGNTSDFQIYNFYVDPRMH
jgi:hypothetical protein